MGHVSKVSFSRVILFFLIFGFILFLSKCSFDKFFSNKILDDIDIQISEVKVKKFGINYIDLELCFSLNNKSNVEFQVNELDLGIYKTDKYEELLGSSSMKDSFIVYPDTLTEFKSQVKVKTFKMGVAALSNTLSGKHSFFILVNSKVEYKNIKIPPITIKKRMDYDPITLEVELK
tara:strand:- start:1478 stop:2005 length:528 start_codon:yes stop_codon:yes gene_type:complete